MTIVIVALIIGLTAIVIFSLAAFLFVRRRKYDNRDAELADLAVRELDAALDAAIKEINRLGVLVKDDVDDKYKSILFMYKLIEERTPVRPAHSDNRGSINNAERSLEAGVRPAHSENRGSVNNAERSLEAGVRTAHSENRGSVNERGRSLEAGVRVTHSGNRGSINNAERSLETGVRATHSGNRGTAVERGHSLDAVPLPPVAVVPAIKKPPRFSSPKHQQIWKFYESGVAISEIARDFGIGQGEVKLILEIASKTR